MTAAIEMLETERQGRLDLACEHRLVDLDRRTAGLSQAPDLGVERIRERRRAGGSS